MEDAKAERVCKKCNEIISSPVYWVDDADEGVFFCVLHKPQEGAHTVMASVPKARKVGKVGEEVHPGADGVIGAIQQAKEEIEGARSELQSLRHTLGSVDTSCLLEATLSSHQTVMVAGDKTDWVLAHTELGGRVDRQLVGLQGVLRLTEKAKENSVPLWSVGRGKLVAAVGTVAATGGLPYHLRLESAHSEMQVWCRSEDQLDAWLEWVRRSQPQAVITRRPPRTTGAVATRQRPSMSFKSTSLGRASHKPRHRSPATVLFGENNTDSGESETTTTTTTTGRQSRHSPNWSPTGSLDRKFGKGMLQWARKLSDRAVDYRNRQNVQQQADASHLDVFTASLEDLMAEQRELVPDAPIPLLLPHLADAVIKNNGHRTEGIFRISASHEEVAEATRAIQKAVGYDYEAAIKFKDPHLPAALLKQWLRDLPVPLFEDYFRCIEVSRMTSKEQAKGYQEMMGALSDVHRNVVIFLVKFLISVGDKANVPFTKMPLANLALVFVPSFLRCPNGDISLILINQPAEQNFVQTLVEEYATDPAWLEAWEPDELHFL